MVCGRRLCFCWSLPSAPSTSETLGLFSVQEESQEAPQVLLPLQPRGRHVLHLSRWGKALHSPTLAEFGFGAVVRAVTSEQVLISCSGRSSVAPQLTHWSFPSQRSGAVNSLSFILPFPRCACLFLLSPLFVFVSWPGSLGALGMISPRLF